MKTARKALTAAMKRHKKLTIAAVIVLAVIPATIALFLLAPRFRGAPYHNACIRKASQTATAIEIRCKAYIPESHQARVVTITDPEQIKWLLRRFELPPSLEIIQRVHACLGNLAVTIRTPSVSYILSYDHGSGMYPISSRWRREGFVDMDRQACAELNEYFESLGFTKREIGRPQQGMAPSAGHVQSAVGA